jgi:hypothetical protein
MGDARRARTTRMYATVTWSVPVPVLVAAVPAATFVAVGLWGIAGAGLALAVVVVAALVGGLCPPGVAAGIGSAVVVAVGTALAGLLLVVVAGAVLP